MVAAVGGQVAVAVQSERSRGYPCRAACYASATHGRIARGSSHLRAATAHECSPCRLRCHRQMLLPVPLGDTRVRQSVRGGAERRAIGARAVGSSPAGRSRWLRRYRAFTIVTGGRDGGPRDAAPRVLSALVFKRVGPAHPHLQDCWSGAHIEGGQGARGVAYAIPGGGAGGGAGDDDESRGSRSRAGLAAAEREPGLCRGLARERRADGARGAASCHSQADRGPT